MHTLLLTVSLVFFGCIPSDPGPKGDSGSPEIFVDVDGDGYTVKLDCDDTNPNANPTAPEVCDTVDNDCDGQVDEGDATDGTTWYPDNDGDGHGDTNAPVVACTQPSGYITNGDDCNDTNAAINPTAAEVCDSQDVDENCNGAADGLDGGATEETTWYYDDDKDGFGDPLISYINCERPPGFVEDGTDCDDTAAAANPDGIEVCDGLDNNCDGSTDGDDAIDAIPWYVDADHDGWGSTLTVRGCGVPPEGYTVPNGTDFRKDCNDADPAVYPDAAEVCDDFDTDEDCDPTTTCE